MAKIATIYLASSAMQTFSARDAKNLFGQLLEKAMAAPVVIEKHGRQVAVLLSALQYQEDQRRLKGLEKEMSVLKSSNGILLDQYECAVAKYELLKEQLQEKKEPDQTPESASECDAFQPLQPLSVHQLSSQTGRFAFLWSLYEEYHYSGLMAATAHIWNSLESPKTSRAEAMAAKLGMRGKGKTALRKFLKQFIDTLDEAMSVIPNIPDLSSYPDFERWNEDCKAIFQQMDSVFGTHASKFEAILNGENPPSVETASEMGALIIGPWAEALRRKTSEGVQKD